MEPEHFRSELENRGAVETVRTEFRDRKTLELVMEKATVTE